MDVVETLTRRLLDVFDVSLRHPCGVCHYAICIVIHIHVFFINY